MRPCRELLQTIGLTSGNKAVNHRKHNKRLWSSAGLRMPIHAHFWMILTSKVSQVDLVFGLWSGFISGSGPCMQDYKSLCLAIMVTIWATLVNSQTHTHRQTAHWPFYMISSAELNVSIDRPYDTAFAELVAVILRQSYPEERQICLPPVHQNVGVMMRPHGVEVACILNWNLDVQNVSTVISNTLSLHGIGVHVIRNYFHPRTVDVQEEGNRSTSSRRNLVSGPSCTSCVGL